jgi:hypothetical protein
VKKSSQNREKNSYKTRIFSLWRPTTASIQDNQKNPPQKKKKHKNTKSVRKFAAEKNEREEEK